MLSWHHQQLSGQTLERLREQLHRNLTNLSNVLNGGLQTVTVATTYTIGLTDDLVLANATAVGFTVTLPPVAEALGRVVRVKKTDAGGNVVTVDGNAAETIEGSANKTITVQYQVRAFYSDGAVWWLL